MNAVTSAEITDKLAALDIALNDFEVEFDKHANEAVAGVAGAGQKASEVNSRIERLQVERRILERARVSAFKREQAEAEEVEAAARAKHLDDARLNARLLVDQADHVDRLINDLRAAMSKLQDRETAVHNDLRAARAMPDYITVGRKNLVGIALQRLSSEVDGAARYKKDDRGCGHWARVGWQFLLNVGSQEDAA